MNIVQTFLNEKDLYDAVIELPETKEFIPLITKLATHPKFKYIECKSDRLSADAYFKYLRSKNSKCGLSDEKFQRDKEDGGRFL